MPWVHFASSVFDIFLKELKRDLSLGILGCLSLVEVKDMGSNAVVGFLVVDISHNKNAVESRQYSIL